MAKAKKLPSGQWRTLVYSHTDVATQKRKYKSFTADTKWESEQMAAEYRSQHKERQSASGLDMTVKEAMDRYIASKEAVISPRTVKEYLRMAKSDYKDLESISLKNLSHESIQKCINAHTKTKSPKSVRNIHGFLSAVLAMFYPEYKLSTTLPQKRRYEPTIPTDDDIKKLINAAEGTEAEIPILLASSGSLRRSEIAEVRLSNITDSGVYIKQASVKNKDKQWVQKGTKSAAGYRFVPLPQEIINKLKKIEPIGDDDRLVKLNPNVIYKRFAKALKDSGIPHIRFHDLRHYYASVLHALGVPDKYIMQYGGWETDTVLKNVYQHTMSDREKIEQEKILNHFKNITKGD